MKPTTPNRIAWLHAITAISLISASSFAQNTNIAANPSAEIRTPKAPATPRINGPAIFGVRPEHPFLYHIPATGDRPMAFSVKNLPPGLKVDAESGDITGSLQQPGEYKVTLHAKNSLG